LFVILCGLLCLLRTTLVYLSFSYVGASLFAPTSTVGSRRVSSHPCVPYISSTYTSLRPPTPSIIPFFLPLFPFHHSLPLYSFILTDKPTLPAFTLFTPFAAPNLKAKGASGGPVLFRPGLNTKLIPGALLPPVNMTALDKTTPWQMSTRTTSGGSIVECEDAGRA
jgi:hypothetical protein